MMIKFKLEPDYSARWVSKLQRGLLWQRYICIQGTAQYVLLVFSMICSLFGKSPLEFNNYIGSYLFFNIIYILVFIFKIKNFNNLKHQAILKLYKTIPDPKIERIVELTEKNILMQCDEIEIRCPLVYIREVRELDEAYYVRGAFGFHFFVPFTAFNNDEARKKFYSEINLNLKANSPLLT